MLARTYRMTCRKISSHCPIIDVNLYIIIIIYEYSPNLYKYTQVIKVRTALQRYCK